MRDTATSAGSCAVGFSDGGGARRRSHRCVDDGVRASVLAEGSLAGAGESRPVALICCGARFLHERGRSSEEPSMAAKKRGGGRGGAKKVRGKVAARGAKKSAAKKSVAKKSGAKKAG